MGVNVAAHTRHIFLGSAPGPMTPFHAFLDCYISKPQNEGKVLGSFPGGST